MNMDPEPIQQEPPSDESDPIQEEANDGDQSFFHKLREKATSFRFEDFEFDRFCYRGEVIDGFAEQLDAEDLPKMGKEFVEEHAEIVQSKSEVLRQTMKEGWDSSKATLSTIPSTLADRWNEAAKTYHERKKNETTETSSELALQQ